jgi:hypothetical protein
MENWRTGELENWRNGVVENWVDEVRDNGHFPLTPALSLREREDSP